MISLGLARFIANSRENDIRFQRELYEEYKDFFKALETQLLE